MTQHRAACCCQGGGGGGDPAPCNCLECPGTISQNGTVRIQFQEWLAMRARTIRLFPNDAGADCTNVYPDASCELSCVPGAFLDEDIAAPPGYSVVVDTGGYLYVQIYDIDVTLPYLSCSQPPPIGVERSFSYAFPFFNIPIMKARSHNYYQGTQVWTCASGFEECFNRTESCIGMIEGTAVQIGASLFCSGEWVISITDGSIASPAPFRGFSSGHYDQYLSWTQPVDPCLGAENPFTITEDTGCVFPDGVSPPVPSGWSTVCDAPYSSCPGKSCAAEYWARRMYTLTVTPQNIYV